MTPEKMLSEHPLTIELKRRGLTDEQLLEFHFLGNNGGHPFDLWSFTWPEGLSTEALSLVKPFCALKWLLLDEPPSSRDTDDAWRLVADFLAAPLVAKGISTAERQRQNQERMTDVTRKYDEADRERWKAIAATLRGSKLYKAGVVANREDLPSAAISTIRKAI
jgi:hypothetical protein